MSKKGDMYYAWTSDAELAKKAECGGAVTSLLKLRSRRRWSMRCLR